MAITSKEGPLEGSRIRELRRRLGVTQQELACRIDVDQGTVSRWERGVERPRPARMAKLHTLLLRDEERRQVKKSIAVVRHDFLPATLLDENLRLIEASASAERLFRDRGQKLSQLMGVSFESYADRMGVPTLMAHVRESGLLRGDALFFRFVVNAYGKGNATVWEPVFEDGRLVCVLNYVAAMFSFPANDEFTIELVDFVPGEDPSEVTQLHRGPRMATFENRPHWM
ncbi:helix-turn-helix domain-containing protein [Rhodovulum sp. YNF3179]|uniref:helix-turn-helix domain-containing protein n=1 Tax=Rhodovulum sp. YNF3179 TaxID=3425127 RepID=UPI003D32C1BD